jgi:hypothetical protein
MSLGALVPVSPDQAYSWEIAFRLNRYFGAGAPRTPTL